MNGLKKGRYFLRLFGLIFLMCTFVCGCRENVKVEVENIAEESEEEQKEEQKEETGLFNDALAEISGEADLVRTFSWGKLPEGYEIVSWRYNEQTTKFYEDINELNAYGEIALPERCYTLVYNKLFLIFSAKINRVPA